MSVSATPLLLPKKDHTEQEIKIFELYRELKKELAELDLEITVLRRDVQKTQDQVRLKNVLEKINAIKEE